jgi:hypothetical protein
MMLGTMLLFYCQQCCTPSTAALAVISSHSCTKKIANIRLLRFVLLDTTGVQHIVSAPYLGQGEEDATSACSH